MVAIIVVFAGCPGNRVFEICSALLKPAA